MLVMLDVSAPVAGGGFVALTFAAIGLAGKLIELLKERTRQKRLREIGESEGIAVWRDDEDTKRLRKRAEVEREMSETLETRCRRLEWDLEDRTQRVQELENELAAMARDLTKTAAELDAERSASKRAREESAEMRRNAEVLRAEIDEVLRSVQGGHSGLGVTIGIDPDAERLVDGLVSERVRGCRRPATEEDDRNTDRPPGLPRRK